MNPAVVYPRKLDRHTVYLKNVVWGPNIIIDDFTFYNDFENDPCDFQKNNVHIDQSSYKLFGDCSYS